MRRTILLLISLSFAITSFGQGLSNRGKEFWLAYCYHVSMINTSGGLPVMTLYMTSDVNTTYNVSIYNGATISAGNILANQVTPVVIPTAYFIDGNGMFNSKAIKVTAAAPIVIYSYITKSAISGATLCLPTNVLGTEYRAMSFTQKSNEANSNSYITIVGVEDNTTVEIIPTAATVGGWAAGSVNTITLNKGQIYQVLGTTTGNNGVDLSGTTIRSIAPSGGGCKKIAVFSGCGKVTIANGTCGASSSDNLYQQLYPISSWGKKILTVPSINRTNNFYRIWRKNSTATVSLNGAVIPPASFTNDYFQVFNNTPNKIESDQPVAVTQYFTTETCNGNSSPYDPDMIVMNPVEQNIRDVTLISSNLVAGNPQHHIMVIMKNAGTALSSFRFDGAIPATAWITHPQDPGYSYLALANVSQSSHRLVSDSGFNAYAYGYANAESYGYSAGTNVIDLYQQNGIFNPLATVPTVTSTCVGSQFKWKISFPYQPVSLDWNFHGSFPNVTQNSPLTPDSIVNVNGINVYWYSLPGMYAYPTAGSYPVTVTVHTAGVDNCGSERDIDFEMTVNAKPTATFSFNSPACLSEPVSFVNAINSSDPIYQWNYNFGDASSSTSTTNPTHTYTTPGTYNASFYAVNTYGCVTDTTTQPVVVPTNPTATISGTADVCKDAPTQNVTFTGSGGVAPYTFTYTLNGGAPQTIATTGTATTATISVPTNVPLNNVYQLQSVSTGTHANCVKPASGTVTIVVRDVTTATISGGATVCEGEPSPQVTFTGATGPQPYTFTYNINGGANQTVTTAAGVATALVNVPTNTPGTFIYNIINVADATGQNCVTPPTGSATFVIKPKPVVNFTTSSPVCNTRSITITPTTTISGGSVQTWAWDFGDGTTQNSTNSNPFVHVYANAATVNTSVIVTSDLGCTDTATQSVVVNPRPVVGFINPNVCLADVVGAQFADTSHVSSGNITTWQWNFGDPASGAANSSTQQNPTHYYNTTGPRDVQLIVTTNNNCKDTVVQQIMINGSIPVANFTVQNNNNLCSNDSVRITNTSTVDVGNITKIEVYWDFANNPTVFDLHNFPPSGAVWAHRYPISNTDILYTIKMRAFSGITCISEKTQTVTVHAKPEPVFAAVPNVCLHNGTVQLIQGSEQNGIAGAGTYWGAGVGLTGVFNPLTAGVGTHTLTYVYTTNFGCKDSTTQTVTVLTAPTVSFTSSAPKCNRSAITFTPSQTSLAGNIVKWAWNYGDSSPVDTVLNSNPVSHIYSNAGSYTVTVVVITDYGCKSLPFSATIVVNPTPVPQFTYSASACLPQASIAFTNTTPNVTDFNYNWNFGEAGSPTNNSSSVNPTHVYLSQGPFSVTLTATSATTGCTHDTTISVTTIHPAPIASFSFSPASVCLGFPMQVTDGSQASEGTLTGWSWNFGDGSAAVAGQNPGPKTYNSAGTFSIKLTATNSFGCTDDSTITFTVYPYPVANAGVDLFILEGGYMQTGSSATGNGLSYLWTSVPSGFNSTLSSTTVLQPVITPTQDMYYLLTVTNDGGCEDTSGLRVIVLKALDIPNTFSPNNDGINDYWTIQYLETYPRCKVQVFTRTGQKVFESRGYKTPWDGNMNGKSLPVDTYYYVIEPQEGRKPVTGFVTIIK